MKHLFRTLSLVTITVLISACGEDFLDIKPLSIFTPESIYVDADGFNGVLVAMRKNLRGDFYGESSGLSCELIASDIAVSANKATNAIHNFDTQVVPSGTGTNYDFHDFWTRGYNQIRSANVVLSRIENGTFANEKEKNAISGD